MGCSPHGRGCSRFKNSERGRALTPAARSMDKIIEQLGQNSTWRGLILIVGALGWQLSPEHNEAIVAAALALVGLINVFRKG